MPRDHPGCDEPRHPRRGCPVSNRLLTAIWDSGQYDKTTLLVLLALADQANDAGVCWPSVPTVAARARCSERHVQRVIAGLESDGVLTIQHRAGTSNLYRINVERFTTHPRHPVGGDNLSGVTPDVGGGVTPDVTPGATPRSPKPSLNPQRTGGDAGERTPSPTPVETPPTQTKTATTNPAPSAGPVRADRCPTHQQDTDPPACRGCRDARLAHEQAQAEAARARSAAASAQAKDRARLRGAEIAACGLCDDRGYDRGLPCAHDASTADRLAVGVAAARAALNRASLHPVGGSGGPRELAAAAA
jgi:hypothetical protein